MKRFLLLGLLGAMLSMVCVSRQATAQPNTQISLNVFYDRLAPYGDWMPYQNYGRVWRPRVDRDFIPYSTNGRWVYTDYGNSWESDYDWGWAPFHYGRWIYDDSYGWMWLPDTEWAPAWVSWRSGGGYYGWAPLGPGMSVNININIPLLRWVFCPARYVMNPRISQYCVPRNRNTVIINNTTVINNIYYRDNRRYFAGPQHRELERRTGQRVAIQRPNFSRPDNYRNGSGYRPDMGNGNRPRPNDNRWQGRDDNRGDRNNGYYGQNQRPNFDRPSGRPDRPNSRPDYQRPQSERPTTLPSMPGRPDNNRPSNGIRDNDRPQGSYPSQRPQWNNGGRERDGGWNSDGRRPERNIEQRPQISRDRNFMVTNPRQQSSIERQRVESRQPAVASNNSGSGNRPEGRGRR